MGRSICELFGRLCCNYDSVVYAVEGLTAFPGKSLFECQRLFNGIAVNSNSLPTGVPSDHRNLQLFVAIAIGYTDVHGSGVRTDAAVEFVPSAVHH